MTWTDRAILSTFYFRLLSFQLAAEPKAWWQILVAIGLGGLMATVWTVSVRAEPWSKP